MQRPNQFSALWLFGKQNARKWSKDRDFNDPVQVVNVKGGTGCRAAGGEENILYITVDRPD